MTSTNNPGPTTGPTTRAHPGPTGPALGPTGPTAGPIWARRTIAIIAGLLLASVVIAPSVMSAQDIVAWARSTHGLNATGIWPYVAFYALDAAAVFCVLMGSYSSWVRGESPGIFRWLVWVFAFGSAVANYAFALAPGAGASQWWFYPAMSLLGPVLLEATLHRVRRWVAEQAGRRSRTGVSFPLTEWLPITGHFRETFGAWRLARFVDMTTNPDGTTFAGNLAARARFTYRALCPDGTLRVFGALRAHQAAALALTPITLPGLIPADLLPAGPTSPGPGRAHDEPTPGPTQDDEPTPGPTPATGPTARTHTGPTDGPTRAHPVITTLLAKHADRLIAVRTAYGTDDDGKTWLDCTRPISRRAVCALLHIPDGRTAREVHTCLTHLRADSDAAATLAEATR